MLEEIKELDSEGGVATRSAVMPDGLKQLPKTYVDKFKEGVRTDDY